jgi:hypothetical protein
MRVLEIINDHRKRVLKTLEEQLQALLSSTLDAAAASPQTESSASVLPRHDTQLETVRASIHALTTTVSLADFLNGNCPVLLEQTNLTREQILWDEKLIDHLFSRIMHTVVSKGIVLLSTLLKDVRIDWTKANTESRITDYLAALNGVLEAHSMLHLWDNPASIDMLIKYITRAWPKKVYDAWSNHIFTTEEIRTCDQFTMALKRVSNNVGVVEMNTKNSDGSNPHGDATSNNDSKHRRPEKRKEPHGSKNTRKAHSKPNDPNYKCPVCHGFRV